MSPSDPPVGLPVATVLVPTPFVPKFAFTKPCTSEPMATPKFVLAVAAVPTSLKLFDACKTCNI